MLSPNLLKIIEAIQDLIVVCREPRQALLRVRAYVHNLIVLFQHAEQRHERRDVQEVDGAWFIPLPVVLVVHHDDGFLRP